MLICSIFSPENMLTFVKSGSNFLFQADFSTKFTKGFFVSRNHIGEIPLFCNAGTPVSGEREGFSGSGYGRIAFCGGIWYSQQG
ncbi:MAG: hypothetical protein HFG08_06525 [Oscillibacter sp.]|nr:hypothetical protein [Oscillibacter sp.]